MRRASLEFERSPTRVHLRQQEYKCHVLIEVRNILLLVIDFRRISILLKSNIWYLFWIFFIYCELWFHTRHQMWSQSEGLLKSKFKNHQLTSQTFLKILMKQFCSLHTCIKRVYLQMKSQKEHLTSASTVCSGHSNSGNCTRGKFLI